MDMKVEQTPFDQKLFLVFIATFAAMTTFEFAGIFLYPYPPDWRSNLVLSFFVSGLAVIVAYFPLKSTYIKNIEILQEIEKCHFVESELRESESLYRTIFENTGTAMAILEDDTTISHVNEEMERIWGYSRQEIEGRMKWPNLITEESRGKMLEYHQLRRTDPGSVPKSYEFSFLHKNGTVRHAALTAAMIPGTGKSVISVRDITELRKTNEALEKSESIFRQLEGELPDYVIIHEGETIVFVNAEGARLMGKPPGQIIGTSVLSYAAPEYHDLIIKNIMLRYRGVDVKPYDIEIIAPSGERRWVVTRATSLRNREKPATLTVLTDITERKRAEEALRQANKNLNLLSGITRHDINNQLQALNGFVELLRRKIPDPSFDDYFSRIMEASSRITAMIRFTREYEEIGVHAAVWQDLQALVNSAGNGATLGEVMLKNDLPANAEVFADPLIARVFFNLIDNALRHGGSITTIRFSCGSSNGNGVLVCEDDGDGVASEDKERIFHRGFGKNTGYGLALSREILGITGITITETGEPGRGARFEIVVPKEAFRVVTTQKTPPQNAG